MAQAWSLHGNATVWRGCQRQRPPLATIHPHETHHPTVLPNRAMNLYLLFLTVATLTVLSPGPGVLMTLTNALRYGLRGTIGGILGIAFGALLVAGISATTLGAVLAASALAFTVLKLAGAAYLIYLGARLWRSPPMHVQSAAQAHQASFKRRFLEGLSLQLTNPKAIFFFLSVFPQFIEGEAGFVGQLRCWC